MRDEDDEDGNEVEVMDVIEEETEKERMEEDTVQSPNATETGVWSSEFDIIVLSLRFLSLLIGPV